MSVSLANRSRTVFDTSADQHFSNDINNFSDNYVTKKVDVEIATANGMIRPQGFGSRMITCQGTGYELVMNKVLYLPNCAVNLFGAKKYFATGQMRQKITSKGTLITDDEGNELFYIDEDCFIIEEPVYAFPAVTTAKPKETSIDLWHRRLGHLSKPNVQKTATLVKGVVLHTDQDGLTRDEREERKLRKCEPCELSNPRRTTRKSTTRIVNRAFDEVHVDVVLYRKAGIDGQQYATVFTDKATSVRWAYFHKKKNGAYDALVQHQKHIRTQYGRVIKKWRLDGGKEYSPIHLGALAKKLGQIVETTTPYTPEQDGTSERSIGIICAKVRAVVEDLDIPKFLWPLIFEAIIDITNKSATSLFETTPYQRLMDEFYPDEDNVPSLGHLRTLGCKTYVEIPLRVQGDKLSARAQIGILVGYEGHNIFRVYVPSTRKVV
jgi:hypothetical protein